jgi:hypothetical protein
MLGRAQGETGVLHAYTCNCVIMGMHNKQVGCDYMEAGDAGVLVGGAGAVVPVWSH